MPLSVSINQESKRSVLLPVIEHLSEVVIGIDHLVVDDLAAFLYRDDIRIDKSPVRFQPEGVIPCLDLLVELRVNIHGISLNEFLPGFVVPFGLDALHFGQKFPEKAAESLVVSFPKRPRRAW